MEPPVGDVAENQARRVATARQSTNRAASAAFLRLKAPAGRLRTPSLKRSPSWPQHARSDPSRGSLFDHTDKGYVAGHHGRQEKTPKSDRQEKPPRQGVDAAARQRPLGAGGAASRLPLARRVQAGRAGRKGQAVPARHGGGGSRLGARKLVAIAARAAGP